MWPPGPGLQFSHTQHAVADSKEKNAELFPATSSRVLWISNDLRRVAALGNYMLSDATFVHSVWHFGCNLDTKTKQWQRVGQSGRSGFRSTALWQCLLTMSTCLSTIQPLFQQTTNIWKIPAQTDVTCSGVLLQLCSRPSILLISSTIWCSFWLISAPLLSESKRRKNRRENCSTAASQWGCAHLGSVERAKYATKHLARSRSVCPGLAVRPRNWWEGRMMLSD